LDKNANGMVANANGLAWLLNLRRSS